MASLLGNLTFAGQHTLLTTQSNLGAIGGTANLFSINTGSLSDLDVCLFQPSFLAQTAAGPGSIGFGGCTLPPLLFTRTGSTVVLYNPNTTALPGDIKAAFIHSRIR